MSKPKKKTHISQCPRPSLKNKWLIFLKSLAILVKMQFLVCLEYVKGDIRRLLRMSGIDVVGDDVLLASLLLFPLSVVTLAAAAFSSSLRNRFIDFTDNKFIYVILEVCFNLYHLFLL
ncbi:hypothetical protein BDA99DRAFT_508755 [Phascolomyces articulosus]|uniref:Uncharacterized protein n=1 Tax=Phascolomyces articulosus TaxID=60185 RepID=A0AAD5KBC1_9FUNG|nr:hypothetical protein BDA99DRAFT_508755 [Phascolomyces articulosus]